MDKNITNEFENKIIYENTKSLLETIAIEDNLEKIFKKIVSLAENNFPDNICSILLLDKTKKHLLSKCAPSLPKFYNEAINGVEIGEKVGSCGAAVYNKKRIIVENINTHENWQAYLELTQKANLHACWSEPIISTKGEVFGSFAMYSKKPKSPTKFELELINTYANLVSIAIEKNNNLQTIKNSKNEIETLFNNTLSGLLYISKERLLIKANQRAADIFKYDSPEQMKGISMKELHVCEENYIQFGQVHFNSLVMQKRFNIEYPLKRKDGSTIWAEISGQALDKNIPANLSKGILWTINDISLRKEKEEELKESTKLLYQQSKVASLGEMLGNISHQWRQPLSAISTLASSTILKKEMDSLSDKELLDNMNLINEQVTYLSNTIDDFRNFFLNNDNKAQNLNIKDSIQKTFSLLKDSYSISSIETVFDLEDCYKVYNENIFIQAILNIFNNAKDALVQLYKQSKRYVFVKLTKEEDFYTLTIKDNANGIKDEFIEKIFDPYFTTKHQSQGTGIGLYMTNQIITKHLKGEIFVQTANYTYKNKNYIGALFTIKIPL